MVRQPGIEPGSPAWQPAILPLNHRYYYRPVQRVPPILLRAAPSHASPDRMQQSASYSLTSCTITFFIRKDAAEILPVNGVNPFYSLLQLNQGLPPSSCPRWL
uniref:Uncharacterized protein n=1 Tax=Steinernema glaseri TaxID=37863 RepID=A0A1I7YVV4_9BILA